MNDFIKIIKSFGNSGVLFDEVTETVKHEIKKQEGKFLRALPAPLAASLVQSVISSVVQRTNGRGVRRVGKWYMDKVFSFCFIFWAISKLLMISIMNLDLMVFFQKIIFLEQHMERMLYTLMMKVVKEHTGFHYYW